MRRQVCTSGAFNVKNVLNSRGTRRGFVTKMEKLAKEFLQDESTFLEQWNHMSMFAYKFIQHYFEYDEAKLEKFKEEVQARTTNEDKIKYVLNLESFPETVQRFLDELFRSKEKTSKSSNEKRSDFAGDNLHSSKAYVDRLSRNISKLIVEPIGSKAEESEALMRLLCERARLHYDLGHFEEALQDAKICQNYQSADETLKNFEEACEERIAQGQSREVKNGEIEVTTPNSLLKCASACIEMAVDDVKGRYYRSTRKIEQNTVIGVEPSYVHWLAPSLFHEYCTYCLKRVDWQYFYCPTCWEVKYCSLDCLRQSWSEYHKVECPNIHVLKHFAIGYIAFRILIMTGWERVLSVATGPLSTTTTFERSYRCIYSLAGEEFVKDSSYLAAMCVTAALVTLFARKIGFIEDHHMYIFGAIVYKHIAQVYLNTFTLYDENIQRTSIRNVFSSHHKMRKIGTGLYCMMSLFSHSCDYDAARHHLNNKIIIVAQKTIKANDEVTISYGTSVAQASLKNRRQFLENNFGFECACKACLKNEDYPAIVYRCLTCKGPLVRTSDGQNSCMFCVKKVTVDTQGGKLKEADNAMSIVRSRLNSCKTSKVKQMLAKCEKVYRQYYVNPIALDSVYALYVYYYYIKRKYLKGVDYTLKRLELYKQNCTKGEVEMLNLVASVVFFLDAYEKEGPKKAEYEEEKNLFKCRVNALMEQVEKKELFIVHDIDAMFLPR